MAIVNYLAAVDAEIKRREECIQRMDELPDDEQDNDERCMLEDELDSMRRERSEIRVLRVMTAAKAMIYCLEMADKTKPIDGEYVSKPVKDCHGQFHWISWAVKRGDKAIPKLCSESSTPFVVALEPYTVQLR